MRMTVNPYVPDWAHGPVPDLAFEVLPGRSRKARPVGTAVLALDRDGNRTPNSNPVSWGPDDDEPPVTVVADGCGVDRHAFARALVGPTTAPRRAPDGAFAFTIVDGLPAPMVPAPHAFAGLVALFRTGATLPSRHHTVLLVADLTDLAPLNPWVSTVILVGPTTGGCGQVTERQAAAAAPLLGEGRFLFAPSRNWSALVVQPL